jgi:hypothetical protein
MEYHEQDSLGPVADATPPAREDGGTCGEPGMKVRMRDPNERHDAALFDRDGEEAGRLVGVSRDRDTDQPRHVTPGERSIGRGATFASSTRTPLTLDAGRQMRTRPPGREDRPPVERATVLAPPMHEFGEGILR